jgi:hypothetical protein
VPKRLPTDAQYATVLGTEGPTAVGRGRMYKPRGLSDATGYPVGAGAGGSKGSLAPADVAPVRYKGVPGLVGL